MNWALLASVIFCSTLYGQLTCRFSRGLDAEKRPTLTFSGPCGAGGIVIDASYSADEVSETTRTLGDGTQIKQNNNKVHQARDSHGRTRTEGPWPGIVLIHDPVANVGYILEDQNKVAHRITVNSTTSPHGGGTFGADVVRHAEIVTENLGSQVIEGIVAEGTRTTTTYPVGLLGNDRPMVVKTEFWVSPQLQRFVLSKMTGPQTGDRTFRLTNISLAEPDPALFQPPPDYTIVDEKDTVTITLKRR